MRSRQSLPASPVPELAFAERVGILGGTFDPPHIGHLVLATQVRHHLELDRVLLVVANDPWQKTSAGRRIAPAEARFEMVAACCAGVAGLVASRIEIDRGGPSYMIDTVSAMTSENRSLFLIVGADAAETIATWARPNELAGAVTLAVARRARHPVPEMNEPWRSVDVPLPALDISSTELRAMVAEGRPVDFLVPGPAVEVIRRLGLYQAHSPSRARSVP
jgi:nicotinate-nucleotide adenylyltransferase